MKKKSACSVRVPWMVDEVACGTWPSSDARILFGMTRTRNVAICVCEGRGGGEEQETGGKTKDFPLHASLMAQR